MFSLTLAVCTVAVAYMYPLYATFKVLTSPSRPGSTSKAFYWHKQSSDKSQAPESDEHPTELSQLEQWSMYWCILASFRILEIFLGWAWQWVPFYTYAKFFFFLWLVLPQTNGTLNIFTEYLAPFLAAHENDVDAMVEKGQKASMKLFSTSVQVVVGVLRTGFEKPGTQERSQYVSDASPGERSARDATRYANTATPASETPIAKAGAIIYQHTAPMITSLSNSALDWLSSTADAKEKTEERTPQSSGPRAKRRKSDTSHPGTGSYPYGHK
ncbi:hypothetical protein MVES_002733 [Malassezia vespertilionis]|uniref:Protein YOP1 n=1 Tax=Malassezia vespertilionis TaxID=2020962 RepID=A0A2N1J989_9BASI|nr:hypothetical protein MVES_002733 [Malassezia vespertilionis]